MGKNQVDDFLVLKEIEIEGYEKIVLIEDVTVNLRAIICVHNTSLGPALGGVRIYPYSSYEDALRDVQRLAQGMSYKAALSAVSFGGGKSVIICDPKKKDRNMLISFARAVDRLKGLYICAEDSGSSVEDMNLIAAHTPYVVGSSHPKGSGNPSPFTAWGVFYGIQALMYRIYGSNSVEGKKIAIQGLGNVGSILAEILFWHGARLLVSDVDQEKVWKAVKSYGAETCLPEEIFGAESDFFVPCALGGVINPLTIPFFRCRAIAGAANNQLLSREDDYALHKRGIIYAPDFVINAGGLINVSEEVAEHGYNPAIARKKSGLIYHRILELSREAEKNSCSLYTAALLSAENRIRNREGMRERSPCYHHFEGSRS